MTAVKSPYLLEIRLGEFTPDQATLDCAPGTDATVKVPEKSVVYKDFVVGGLLTNTAAF